MNVFPFSLAGRLALGALLQLQGSGSAGAGQVSHDPVQRLRTAPSLAQQAQAAGCSAVLSRGDSTAAENTDALRAAFSLQDTSELFLNLKLLSI